MFANFHLADVKHPVGDDDCDDRLCVFFQLVIIRQRDKLEPIFQHYLTEDRGAGNTTSYVDFLCHIHKEIRNLMS